MDNTTKLGVVIALTLASVLTVSPTVSATATAFEGATTALDAPICNGQSTGTTCLGIYDFRDGHLCIGVYIYATGECVGVSV